jgi:hypothetical protein
MKLRQLVSMVAWGALVVFMLPMAAAKASALEASVPGAVIAQEPEPTPLEGSQCWARCSACATRCAAVRGSEREGCARTCQAGNDRCCEANGRNGTSRACGCY